MEKSVVQDLLNNIDRTVPVIGDKEYFYQEIDGTMVPFQHYIVREIAKSYGLTLTNEEKNIIAGSGYFGLSLLKCILPKDYTKVYREIVERNIEQLTLSDAVLNFLTIVQPSLIITTSPFDILEKHLPKYRSYYYSCMNDNRGSYFDMSDKNDHVIYHLFGKADKFGRWVSSEYKLLEFIHYLHNDDSRPINLSKYLRNCEPLFLGCEFPDWLFRFIWYSISENKPPYDDSLEEEILGYWMSDFPIESRAFSNFLKEIKYRPQNNVYEILSIVSSISPNDISHNKKYDIFISHASEDKEWSSNLKRDLEKFGLSVWMDSDLPAGNYFDNWENAMQNSRYFMPVVSKSYMYKFTPEAIIKNNGVEPALVLETKYAVDIKKKVYAHCAYSIPVIKDGDEYAGIPLTEGNVEHFANPSYNHLLPPELFLHQHFILRNTENPEKDSFSKHNWKQYIAKSRSK